MALLDGRTAILLGAGPDLGRSTAVAMAREGADIVLVARRAEVIAAVCDEVRMLGRRSWGLRADLTDVDECAMLAERVREVTTHLDIIVSIVGGAGPSTGAEFAFAGADAFQSWRQVFETTFWAPAQTMAFLVDLLYLSDEPHIIVINSVAASRPTARRGAYTAAKSALAGLVRVMAQELGPQGIRVNGLHLGPTRSAAWDRAVAEGAAREGVTWDEMYERSAASNPLGYVPDADEIADAIVFLASARSRSITGQGIHASLGGWMS